MNQHGWEGLGGPVRMENYDYGGIDPALDDCCQREIESNRLQSELQATLNRHDVTVLAERRRRHLVETRFGSGCRCCYDPDSDGGEYRTLMEARDRLKKREEEKKEEAEEDQAVEDVRTKNEVADDEVDHGDEDSDDEFDYLLDEDLPDHSGLQEMEERRRVELEFQMLRLEVARTHGYGTHRQMHPGRILRAAGLSESTLPNPPSKTVLHLMDPDSHLSAELDLYLETIAETYKGTKFMRSGGRSTMLMDASLAKKVLPHLKVEEDMPCLVAVRDGRVVATSAKLKEVTRDNELVTHAVRSWLESANVLEESAPAFDDMCRIRPEEDALLDTMRTTRQGRPQQEPDERYDCGVEGCNKTFPHKHVGVQTDTQDGILVSEETVAGVARS